MTKPLHPYRTRGQTSEVKTWFHMLYGHESKTDSISQYPCISLVPTPNSKRFHDQLPNYPIFDQLDFFVLTFFSSWRMNWTVQFIFLGRRWGSHAVALRICWIGSLDKTSAKRNTKHTRLFQMKTLIRSCLDEWGMGLSCFFSWRER